MNPARHAAAPRPGRRRLAGGAAAGLASAALAGCGFRMRGITELPFQTFFSSTASASQIGGELRRAVRVNGATVVDRRQDAEVRFDLLLQFEEHHGEGGPDHWNLHA